MVQHNKTALVTGASRGIGRATALALAETGVRVLVHYGRSAQDAQSVVESIHSKGGRADAIGVDLRSPEGATLLAKEVRSLVGKQLDALVLNAGVSKAATIKDHTVEDFDNLFAHQCAQSIFSGAATPAYPGGRLEHHRDLFHRGPCRSWKARLGQPFDPCLRRNQRSIGDACQELGCHSWASRYSRKCNRARCDRHGHVELR
jgi:nucleoside-diphosphate-sugar epimerase